SLAQEYRLDLVRVVVHKPRLPALARGFCGDVRRVQARLLRPPPHVPLPGLPTGQLLPFEEVGEDRDTLTRQPDPSFALPPQYLLGRLGGEVGEPPVKPFRMVVEPLALDIPGAGEQEGIEPGLAL